ncbi:MAG: hypothetical protein CMK06_11350 [Ponticaulis sp.]|nr:hypothetical protein [Ponticaulis sp.]
MRPSVYGTGRNDVAVLDQKQVSFLGPGKAFNTEGFEMEGKWRLSPKWLVHACAPETPPADSPPNDPGEVNIVDSHLGMNVHQWRLDNSLVAPGDDPFYYCDDRFVYSISASDRVSPGQPRKLMGRLNYDGDKS